jgi:succinoglycan biosynthesis protein ExoA
MAPTETFASMQTMTNTSPSVSVVIPCRNEVNYIASCLASIFDQDEVPGGFEVIVADGMSDDGTREILNQLIGVHESLRMVDNPARITSTALNSGIRDARGRFIAIMGAHAHYARDYLKASLRVSEQTGADNVGGSMICVGNSALQKAIAAAHHSLFAVGGAHWHNAIYEGPADTLFGGFYRREIFDRIGLFDETLVRNQDDDFNFRLTLVGGKIWHSPQIKSWYHPRASLAAVFRQYMQYGYWKVRVICKHGRPASIRHLVPALFVGGLLGLLALGFFSTISLWLALTLIAAYCACDVVASALTAMRNDFRNFLTLLAVFPCYHFGYGVGFLRGVIDFIVLRRAPADSFTRLTRSKQPLRA